MSSNTNSPLHPLPLPEGISESQVECAEAGLSFHILESGYTPERNRPLLLLLHGFPEIAYSWRKVMPSLASAGYYVVAVDQRGYGRTTGWDTSSFEEVDLSQFTLTNLVRDLVVLVYALGYTTVKCVIGHDFGAVSASMCALMRPDMFQSVVMMSHPFKPSTPPPFNTAHGSSHDHEDTKDIHEALAALPTPRKHYKWYNSTPSAAHDWSHPQQGLHAFLRGYIHLKSGDWAHNTPHPLRSWTANELAQMPEYYIMPLHASMPDVVASGMSTENDASATTSWLPDAELAVYVAEWQRTGFQGGLNWYRAQTDPAIGARDLLLFAGRNIEVPAVFVSGERDWGNYQQPGALEGLRGCCRDFRGVRLVEGAGHWPQQERPGRVVEEILGFLGEVGGGG